MTFAVNLAQGASNNTTFRNRIINGAMVIDQRNNGASGTAASVYTVDRWAYLPSQTLKMTWGQNLGSVTPPVGFTNYLGFSSSSAYSIGASDYFVTWQPIEGFNVADFAWGTANAQPITLSFWVRSSLTGTFGGALKNSARNRAYPFTYTVNAANTWEQKSITVAGDTAGTWLTTNGVGIYVTFGMGVGSTLSGTANVWGATDAFSATGATSVVGTNGATFYITGVQLEEGTAASPFEFRQYGTELALCQRYFYRMTQVDSTTGSWNAFAQGQTWSNTNSAIVFGFPVTMRASPTMSVSSGTAFGAHCPGVFYTTTSGVGTYSSNPDKAVLSGTLSGSVGTTIYPFLLTASSGATAWISASAEL